MGGIEAGDWPGWISAAIALLGLIAAGAAGLKRWLLRPAVSSSGIQIAHYNSDGWVRVELTFLEAKTDWPYSARFRVMHPRQAYVADSEIAFGQINNGVSVGVYSYFIPRTRLTERDLVALERKDGKTMARVFVGGLPADRKDIVLEVTIIDATSPDRVVARRKAVLTEDH